ncbi:MAG TPA: polysaccharide deacetylase family protein [Solirubrobacteraceae bacterium]|jgi:peptidoglycan/xylan/chitin deacetylase (PgdA/CDA1 family)|nr:polysaccharide deacetylase family protein [Solirubrobacteraceae bacterium]
MTRGWNWDFEDEPGAKTRGRTRAARLPAPAPPPPPPAGPPPARATQVRRRRLAAGAVALALVVLAIVLATGSGGRANAKTVAGLAGHPHARIVPERDTQLDERSAVGSVLAYTPFVREGSGKAGDVALTFDDGPGPYTPALLGVLERMHVHATFFAIGRMERYFSVSTEREIRDGDVVGDHTENHPMLAQLSAHDQREELFETLVRIEFLGGARSTLFRPPYGSFNATTFRLLHQLRLLMVLWSVDTDDYQQPGVSAIVESALAGGHAGAIILMHDGGGDRTQTIAALPAIIRGLRARHLKLVTVPQMLEDEPPRAGQPLPSNLAGD